MKTIFVSAFIDLGNNNENIKSPEFRLQQFKHLASTGVPIYLIISKCYYSQVYEISLAYPNVHIFKVMELDETTTYKICLPYRENIPLIRNNEKDTFEFIVLMNAKIEFIQYVFNEVVAEQYAWIDFNIFHVFHNYIGITEKLLFINENNIKDNMLIIPGCWQKGTNEDTLWQRINWRFCGGFFVGNRSSISEFIDLYSTHFESALEKNNGLTWEVNFWSYLENITNWTPHWYIGDHNDSLISVATDFFKDENPTHVIYRNNVYKKLSNVNNMNNIEYTIINENEFSFFPSSASFLEFKENKILNIRFVNYKLTPEGCYIIYHPEKYLYTKNCCCILDNNYAIQTHFFMKDKPEDMQTIHMNIQGLEDIRLFKWKDICWFIATQREFSSSSENRMMIGHYDYEHALFSNCTVIEPPIQTACEKNWIPIIKQDELFFIYKWYPFQIGRLNTDNRLEICIEHQTPRFFERMRGSTTFIEDENDLLGIIHFSEEDFPRKYFHSLVYLDRETLLPKKFTAPFVFCKLGIEFCIGFVIEHREDRKYIRFWFSSHDCDTTCMVVPFDQFIFRSV